MFKPFVILGCMTASDFLSGAQHGDVNSAAQPISVPLNKKFTDSADDAKFEGEESTARSSDPSINYTGWSAS